MVFVTVGDAAFEIQYSIPPPPAIIPLTTSLPRASYLRSPKCLFNFWHTDLSKHQGAQFAIHIAAHATPEKYIRIYSDRQRQHKDSSSILSFSFSKQRI
jgi:hypothetical protein